MTEQYQGLADRLASVQAGVADACRDAGRRADEVTLIVVTKFHPASLVRELAALGVRDVGENRHQEAQAKSAELAELDLNWHYIGQLQSKKAKQVAAYASSIHSIDREAVVDPLDRLAADGGLAAPIDAFMQINLTDDEGRGGVLPADIERLAERIVASPALNLRGVMAVAPLDEPAARAFERLAGYSERVRSIEPLATDISAGMTHDFVEAIAHGATHVRIGSAITGKRPEAR